MLKKYEYYSWDTNSDIKADMENFFKTLYTEKHKMCDCTKTEPVERKIKRSARVVSNKCIETESSFSLEYPGLKKEDFKITLSGTTLTIKDTSEVFTTYNLLYENKHDTSKISAKYENGVLTITCPLIETKTIEIQ